MMEKKKHCWIKPAMLFLFHSMDYGLWTMDYGLWTMDYGLWTMDYGLWTMDYGLQTPISKLRTIPFQSQF
jgi:hypothetical protein